MLPTMRSQSSPVPYPLSCFYFQLPRCEPSGPAVAINERLHHTGTPSILEIIPSQLLPSGLFPASRALQQHHRPSFNLENYTTTHIALTTLPILYKLPRGIQPDSSADMRRGLAAPPPN